MMIICICFAFKTDISIHLHLISITYPSYRPLDDTPHIKKQEFNDLTRMDPFVIDSLGCQWQNLLRANTIPSKLATLNPLNESEE